MGEEGGEQLRAGRPASLRNCNRRRRLISDCGPSSGRKRPRESGSRTTHCTRAPSWPRSRRRRPCPRAGSCVHKEQSGRRSRPTNRPRAAHTRSRGGEGERASPTHPSASPLSRSAPASMSATATSAWPDSTARCSGVCPARSERLTRGFSGLVGEREARMRCTKGRVPVVAARCLRAQKRRDHGESVLRRHLRPGGAAAASPRGWTRRRSQERTGDAQGELAGLVARVDVCTSVDQEAADLCAFNMSIIRRESQRVVERGDVGGEGRTETWPFDAA